MLPSMLLEESAFSRTILGEARPVPVCSLLSVPQQTRKAKIRFSLQSHPQSQISGGLMGVIINPIENIILGGRKSMHEICQYPFLCVSGVIHNVPVLCTPATPTPATQMPVEADSMFYLKRSPRGSSPPGHAPILAGWKLERGSLAEGVKWAGACYYRP